MALEQATLRRYLAMFTSPALLVGLRLLFLGQRPFAGIQGLNAFCTWFGIILIVASMVARVFSFVTSRGKNRSVEMTLLGCQTGLIVALIGYWLTTDTGVDLFG